MILKLVGRRLAMLIPTLVGVALAAFMLVELMPGDPASVIAGGDATPEQLDTLRRQMGLDRPAPVRFVDYLTGVARGDLGNSAGSTTTVWNRIEAAAPVTLSLLLVSMVFAVVLGLTGGVLAGVRRGTWVDRSVTAVTSVALAVPSFVVALALALFFAVNRSWLPAGGFEPLGDGFWPWFQRLILPSLALCFASAAEMARQTRSALVDVLEQDFLRACRAKGLRERRILGVHAAKNSAPSVITVLGLQVVRLLSGAVVVERIFAMPGFGSLAVDAIFSRDVILIQGVVLVSAIAVLLTNALVDISCALLTPRARA